MTCAANKAALRRAAASAILLALSLALALGGPHPGAEAQAQPELGDDGFVYPVLEEEDFQLFIKIMGAINAGQDPASFCGQNGADPARTQAVAFKIIVNLNAIITGNHKMLKTNFGPSIVFNGAELGLCDKYMDQIAAVLEAMQGNLFGG